MCIFSIMSEGALSIIVKVQKIWKTWLANFTLNIKIFGYFIDFRSTWMTEFGLFLCNLKKLTSVWWFDFRAKWSRNFKVVDLFAWPLNFPAENTKKKLCMCDSLQSIFYFLCNCPKGQIMNLINLATTDFLFSRSEAAESQIVSFPDFRLGSMCSFCSLSAPCFEGSPIPEITT